MDAAKWRHNLEALTNLAVLALCVFAAVLLIRGRASVPSVAQTLRQAPPDGLQIGSQFPPIEGVSYGVADRTLVLALNTGCRFCEQSIPFYRKLARRNSEAGANLQIVAIFPNVTGDARKFLGDAGLWFQAVGRQDFARLGIQGTPTLILLNRDGTVERLWPGELSPPDQKAVLLALAGPAT